MKEKIPPVVIPELEQALEKNEARYVSAQSLCKVYSLRYNEIKHLSRECGAFKMARKMALVDPDIFAKYIQEKFGLEDKEMLKRDVDWDPELADAVNRGDKKYVRYQEGASLYSMGTRKFMELVREADAVRKIGNVALVSVEKLNNYIEKNF